MNDAYIIDELQLKFLHKLKDKTVDERILNYTHNTDKGFSELIVFIDRIIDTGTYNEADRLVLNSLRNEYKDKL